MNMTIKTIVTGAAAGLLISTTLAFPAFAHKGDYMLTAAQTPPAWACGTKGYVLHAERVDGGIVHHRYYCDGSGSSVFIETPEDEPADPNANRGPAGPAGPQGATGDAGRDGVDGQDGRDGIDGRDGVDGVDGQDGIDGKDGRDGEDGQDGQDGKDGAVGPQGPQGQCGGWFC